MIEPDEDIELDVDSELLFHSAAEEVERGSLSVHFPHVVSVSETGAGGVIGSVLDGRPIHAPCDDVGKEPLPV